MRHMLLRLEAPLMSFGAEAVDAYGVVADFPARSAITGLIGNALGWDRSDGDRLDALQRRLVMGSVRQREGQRIQDFQTAQLGKDDAGWTTRGRPEGRAGGADTYRSPHIRYRDADADVLVLVALRLDPLDEVPDLSAIAAALDQPERPLFIGRKPFLPSGRIFAGWAEAHSVHAALEIGCGSIGGRAQWPAGEGEGFTAELTDSREWRTGVHAGLSRVVQGWIGA